MFSFVHVIFYSLSTCMFNVYIFTIIWITFYSLHFHLILCHEYFSILQKSSLFSLSFLIWTLKVINGNKWPEMNPPQLSPGSYIYTHICGEGKMVSFYKNWSKLLLHMLIFLLSIPNVYASNLIYREVKNTYNLLNHLITHIFTKIILLYVSFEKI